VLLYGESFFFFMIFDASLSANNRMLAMELIGKAFAILANIKLKVYAWLIQSAQMRNDFS